MGPALPASQGPRTWDGGQVPCEGRPDTRWSGQAPPREPRGRSRFRPADCLRTEEITLDIVNLIQGGLHEGSHVQPLIAVVTKRDGPLPLGRPDPAQDRLQPDAVLVGRPDFDW